MQERMPQKRSEEEELPWWAVLLILIGLGAVAYAFLKNKKEEEKSEEG
ncbi:hypothetical protein IPA_01520 [Ignicoccus pacificus DSM 13166]|uniref:Uncharacterized protein n=1 Tax=Ignicoccus pacificus DSM 13166 TaxID=940294 RepID=A0A977KAI1_9CREN|nr:hypothetical protein IPA_01520 [Ignicoccus pacificus DSM 13166]